MSEDEIWKDIEGYEGSYQVSTFGRVRSLDRYIHSKDGRQCYFKAGKILKPRHHKDNSGYLSIGLNKNGESHTKDIHVLVAKAFIPNPMGYKYVNHKDENKFNNRVENLEWCTAKYNCNYGTHIQKMKESKGKRVNQYNLDGSFIASYFGITEAAEKTGCNRVDIGYCCRHQKGNNIVNGYYWRYEGDDSPLEQNKRKRPVIQKQSKDGEIINTYESITDASRKYGCDRRSLNRLCLNGGGEFDGYYWEYAA